MFRKIQFSVLSLECCYNRSRAGSGEGLLLSERNQSGARHHDERTVALQSSHLAGVLSRSIAKWTTYGAGRSRY